MITVTCAVIIDNGKLLAVKRGTAMKMAGFWEFPGGKVEQGENHAASVEREIAEELGIDVLVERALSPVKWHYTDGPHILLCPFICAVTQSTIVKIILHEHEELRWLSHAELWCVEWAAADIAIVKEVAVLLAKSDVH
ncbi:MAG: (deoxy)nucleoside triphosphate pyrophosphohydrolase [Fibrobacterales bacterium]